MNGTGVVTNDNSSFAGTVRIAEVYVIVGKDGTGTPAQRSNK